MSRLDLALGHIFDIVERILDLYQSRKASVQLFVIHEFQVVDMDDRLHSKMSLWKFGSKLI